MEKTAIRHKIKELRRMLTELEKESAAAEVFARLEKTAAFMLADRILMYHSSRNGARASISTFRASMA